MKRALFLLPLLLFLLVLLSGCAGEAKEPAPEWPERLTGEYDDALTFTFRGAEPEAAGMDSQTGRMTALFATDRGTLALGWRRVMRGEAEIMERFLAETGAETGVWDLDADDVGALESYVRLGRGWYCLSAACDGLVEASLLGLVDGEVEASAEDDAVRPRAAAARWLELLPWEEDWTCLLLGKWELDPAAGKEALRSLLASYDWELIDPAAEEGEYQPTLGAAAVPLMRQTSIYLDRTQTRATVPIRFHLRSNGDLYYNGTLRRPLGEGAGEELLAAWTALGETGVNTVSPPRLFLTSGAERIQAVLCGTFSWSHTTRIGGIVGCESDGIPYWEMDYFGSDLPILTAAGPVGLEFAGVSPQKMSLRVFSGEDETPITLEDGRFTPLPGLNTYVLHCRWDLPPETPGGEGSCSYILLIDGAAPPEI